MINVIVGEKETPKEIPFPKLMKHLYGNMIILFDDVKSGTVIRSEEKYPDRPVGMYRTDWCYENFVDYDLPLILKNIYPSIAPEERKHIPDVLRQEVL